MDPGKPVTDMDRESFDVSLNGSGILPYWYFISIHVRNAGCCHTGIGFFLKKQDYEICFYYSHYFNSVCILECKSELFLKFHSTDVES